MSFQIHFTNCSMRQRPANEFVSRYLDFYAFPKFGERNKAEKTSKLMLHIHDLTSCGGGKNFYNFFSLI